ncbi:MAG: cation diffusion facilitator family transporter [Hyphomicrobiaceae bacterium]
MVSSQSTTRFLLILAASFAVAIAKLVASAWTNSSAMLSEAIHSLVGISSQALQHVGLKRSLQSECEADEARAFDRARESAFWGFIVGVLLFSMGAGVAIYDGVHKIFEPQPLTDAHINYVVLGVAMCLTAPAALQSVGEVSVRQAGTGLFAALRNSQDAALFNQVVRNFAAMAGLIVALVGTMAAHLGGVLWADGLASVAIGLVMALVAVFMAIELRTFITGGVIAQEIVVSGGTRTASDAVAVAQQDRPNVLPAAAERTTPPDAHVDPGTAHSGMARGKKAKKNRRRS